jgi:hypothetical protein
MSPAIRARRSVACRATALVQAMVAVVCMGGFTSFSVDVGLYLNTKMELQRTADAAAMAGVSELRSGGDAASAAVQAKAYVKSNAVIGQPLDDSGVAVTCGAWKNGVFVANGTPLDAVQVRLRRSTASGNPVPLMFAKMVGINSVDASAVSVARVKPEPPFKIAGIDSASFSSLGVFARVNGRIVSNGDVSIGYPLGLFVGVNGDARSYAGSTRVGSMAQVTGSTARLDDALNYVSVRAPASNDNAKIAAYLDASNNFNAVGVVDIPAGVYVVRDLNLLAGLFVRLQGEVTFYVTHAFNLAVNVNLLGSTTFDAKNFKVRVVSGATVSFLGVLLSTLIIDLYAPDSDVTIAVALPGYRGRLVAKRLTIAVPAVATFEEDQTLGSPLSADEAIALVK